MISRAFRRAVELVVRAMAELQPWQAWTPTFTASGSMTFTSVSYRAQYKQIGTTVYFEIYADGTTGGTASDAILFTPPVTPAASPGAYGGGCFTYPGSGASGIAGAYQYRGTQFWVTRYDDVNWPLGAGMQFAVNGVYEAV